MTGMICFRFGGVHDVLVMTSSGQNRVLRPFAQYPWHRGGGGLVVGLFYFFQAEGRSSVIINIANVAFDAVPALRCPIAERIVCKAWISLQLVD